MKKISSKIFTIIVICSCIAILVLGGISILESAKLIKSNSLERLQLMACQYAAQFSNDLNIIEYNVDEMETYFLDTFDAEKIKSDPDYLSKYETVIDKYLFYFAKERSKNLSAWCYFNPELSNAPKDVYYVDQDEDGIPEKQDHIPFSYFNNTPTPTDDKQWWYGPVKTKSGFWTNPYNWTLNNGKIINSVSYVKPIFIDDKLIAVLGTYFYFGDMYKTITDIKVYESGYAALYNEKLDVVIHPKYKTGTRYTSDNIADIENGKYANTASEIMKNRYGIVDDQLMAYSKLSNDWVLCIYSVKSEMFADVQVLVVKLISAEVWCIIFSVIIAYIMGLHITEPLRKVVDGARQIGSGNLNVKIDVKTKDEVKTVANSLNDMVINIDNLQNKLKAIAYYDDLTGIANKILFKSKAEELIFKNNTQYAYVILDINKFKVINDIFGYFCGDLLLKYIASALTAEFNGDEIAARYSGDVFHILCHFESRSLIESRLIALSEKISEFKFASDINYKISVCFGIYVIENTNTLIETMGDKAGFAVNTIKDSYASAVYFYNDNIRNRILEEHEIENDMQSALDNNEFKVYIQPKYSLKTMQMEGGEALVRWVNPKKGIISPAVFISVFEKNGFIIKIDMYMLECVCKKLRFWLDSGKAPIVISINQSRLHLHNPEYLTTITGILNKYNISPKLIELEITENAFFENEEKMITIIHELHELGFTISMDDFGSGYSSLNMLHNIEVDVLKIDKKFFNDSSDSERGKKIVNNIISMSNDLNITVVAEGVETQSQVDFLMQTDCNLVQGYYFAKPMPIEEFEKQLPQLPIKEMDAV